MANNARNELLLTFKNLFEQGKYSDFVITCGDDTYNVHKNVVCSRSGFYERAERFAVGKEAEEGRIDLPEDEPAMIKLMIQYIYQGKYDPGLPDVHCIDERIISEGIERRNGFHYNFPHTCGGGCRLGFQEDYDVCPHHMCDFDTHENYCLSFICTKCCPGGEVIGKTLSPPLGDATQLLLHAKMYEIRDKYDVRGLQQLAREKFLRACVKYWKDEQFVVAAHHVYISTPDNDQGLRKIIIDVISTHMQLLNKPTVKALLDRFNRLAPGLLRKRAKDLGWMREA